MATEVPAARVVSVQAVDRQETISVASRSLGAVTVDANDVIDLTAPIAGFAGSERYALIPHTLQDGTVQASVAWLQSLDTPFQAFVVTDPWMIASDYSPEISGADVEDLGLSSFRDARVFAILTIPDDAREISINLRAPIVVNASARRAKQVVLLGEEYRTRHSVASGL